MVSDAVSRTAIKNASVAELVDALDSKSCTFGCAGSIPARGTNKKADDFFIGFFIALFSHTVARSNQFLFIRFFSVRIECLGLL
jgi:hypothetical protein